MHVYEVRPRKDHRDVDLISDALPFRWPVDVNDCIRLIAEMRVFMPAGAPSAEASRAARWMLIRGAHLRS